jgi:predicted enzyme related to lactoylglutathione lyase
MTNFQPSGIRSVSRESNDPSNRRRLAVRQYRPCTERDATVAAVKDAGGTIAEEPYAFPGGRRFTFFDPSGNRLGVWSTT